MSLDIIDQLLQLIIKEAVANIIISSWLRVLLYMCDVTMTSRKAEVYKAADRRGELRLFCDLGERGRRFTSLSHLTVRDSAKIKKHSRTWIIIIIFLEYQR